MSEKMEWYVDGDNFVVADLEYQGGGVGYNEYAGDIKQLDGIIDKDFSMKIRKSGKRKNFILLLAKSGTLCYNISRW